MKTGTRLKIWTFFLAMAFIAGIAVGSILFRQGASSVPNVVHEAIEDLLKKDWANVARYREANQKLAPPDAGEKRVVFFGDSITDSWITTSPEFFAGRPYVDRGIAGQTTPQMLARFQQDVVALRPSVVVILGGINDIAGLTGPSTAAMIENNLKSMAEIARANGIRVVLSSLLPYPHVDKEIVKINEWIETYARSHGFVYLDYYDKLADDKKAMPAGLTLDGLHPNKAGYAAMAPLAEKAVAEALAAPIIPPAAPTQPSAPASGSAADADAADRDKGR